MSVLFHFCISIAENDNEGPKIQTQEKINWVLKITQTIVDTQVQKHKAFSSELERPANEPVPNPINSIDVERPKTIKKTLQRQKPFVEEKIAQVRKTGFDEEPQVQY